MAEILVKRRRPQFAQIPLEVLEDDRLTWKATGLISYLISKPHDWIVRMDDLEKKHKDGKTAVRTALKELESFGYLLRFKIFIDGRYDWRSIIFDGPTTEEERYQEEAEHIAKLIEQGHKVRRVYGKGGPNSTDKNKDDTQENNMQVFCMLKTDTYSQRYNLSDQKGDPLGAVASDKEEKGGESLGDSDDLIRRITRMVRPDKSLLSWIKKQKLEILEEAIATFRKVSSKKEIANPGGYFRSVVEGLLKEESAPGKPGKEKTNKQSEPVPYPNFSFQPGDTIKSGDGTPWRCLSISEAYESIPAYAYIVGAFPGADGSVGIYEAKQFTRLDRALRASDLMQVNQSTLESFAAIQGLDLPQIGANLKLSGYSFKCAAILSDDFRDLYVWDEKYDRCYPLALVTY